MNKMYSVIIAISIMIAMIGIASATGIDSITIGGDTQGLNGQTKSVTVDVSGMSEVGALQLDVTYDPAVITANSITFGSAATGSLTTSNINNTSGKVTIGLISATGISGSGNLATISFTVAGNAGDTTPLQIIMKNLKDFNTLPVTTEPTITGGTFTVIGQQQTFNISGFKLKSTDNSGVPGWTVTLTNNTMTTNTTTNANGMYQFTGLSNGTYNVTEGTMSGWTSSSPTTLTVTIAGADVMNQNFTNTPPVSIPILTTITVTPATASLTVGGSQTFTAAGFDQFNASIAISPAVVWSSSNTTVGTIGATGVFNAQAAGTTTITATNGTSGTVSGTATVVTKLPITNPVVITLKVSPSDAGITTITSPIGTTTTSTSTKITISSGSKVTFNVTPNDGYRFDRFVDKWNGNTYTTSLNPWTDTMESNDVVTAVLVPIETPTNNTVVITLKVSPSDAGITTITSPIGTINTSTSTKITISSGSKVTFNVTPNDGYRFDRFVDKWNGNTYTTSLNPWTDTMVSNDVVTAVLVPIETPTNNTVVNTIRVSPAGAGTVQAVSAVGTTTTPPTTTLIIPVNSKVMFNAIPNKGFKFDHWLDTWGISSSYKTKQNPWTDTMSSSDITTAVFVPTTNTTAI